MTSGPSRSSSRDTYTLRSAGFGGEFYSNVTNRDDFVGEVTRHGFVLERELMSWGPVHYRGAPEHPVGTGFLFRRREPC